MCNYAEWLKIRFGSVDLLYFKKPGADDISQLNLSFFRNVYTIPIAAKNRVSRILGQIAGQAPYFSGWILPGTIPHGLRETQYNLVFSSPRAVMSLTSELADKRLLDTKLHVAAVNDIASLAKKNLAQSAIRESQTLRGVVRWAKLRSAGIGLGKAEINLLTKCCDLFIVQSDAEFNWVKQNAGESLAAKCLQLSNGVDDHFFQVPLQRQKRTLTFVGRIEGEYVRRVEWLLDRVWKPLKKQVPDSEFLVSGKCLDESLIQKMKSMDVTYRPFCENPQDLYRDQTVLVAPIFKGYGLINKVVQSMAAGTIVVGDNTAFNAIPEFESGVHGLVATTPDDFVEAVSQVFLDSEKMDDVRLAARDLISRWFSWNDRGESLIERLYPLGFKGSAELSVE